MIAYLQGRLLSKTGNSCLLMTAGGVGYELFVPLTLSERLSEQGAEISFYVQTIVREDSIDLYGFLEKEDKETFNDLLAISKLGPKTALAILSVFTPQKLFSLVAEEDVKALSQVPGIGLKSAKRIIWELKERGAFKKKVLKTVHQAKPGSVFADALAGLVNLGYKEEEVGPLLKDVLDRDPDLLEAEAIRAVLKACAISR